MGEKDIEDAEYLLALDPPIEYIAVSFAQKAQDLQELIDIMDRLKVPAEKRPKICPKIEKPQALTNIDGIIEKSQALMVARGDLEVADLCNAVASTRWKPSWLRLRQYGRQSQW